MADQMADQLLPPAPGQKKHDTQSTTHGSECRSLAALLDPLPVTLTSLNCCACRSLTALPDPAAIATR